MPVPQITLDQLVSVATAALAAGSQTPIVLYPGDPLLALIQGACLADLQLLTGLEAIASFARAQTSSNVDLDSWFADFGFARLSARRASGQVTIVRGGTGDLVIKTGSQLASSSGQGLYEVIAPADLASPPNDYYMAVLPPPNDTSDGYLIPLGLFTPVNIPVAALSVGSASNVSPGALVAFITAVPNLKSVVNQSAIVNGTDVEGDADARARFRLFIQSLAKGTEPAIRAAIESVLGANADAILLENKDALGTFAPNHFTIVAEDGSGTLTEQEKADIRTAVGAVRAFPISFDITTPTVQTITIEIALRYDEAFIATATEADNNILGDVRDYISALKINEPVRFSRIIHIVMRLRSQFNVILGVDKVTTLATLPSGPPFQQVDGDAVPIALGVFRLPAETGITLTHTVERTAAPA
jgi:uncharacterized phage protein gp47/JayE